MMKEELNSFFLNWLTDKENATEILRENKSYNAQLKADEISGKYYPENKKSFSLYGLSSADILSKKIPALLHKNCSLRKSKYKIQGSIGQGNPVEIPWICIFDLDITSSAQEGYYIAYLFEAKLSGVFLSLNQGWTQYERVYAVEEGKIQINKNANYARSLLKSDQGFSYAPINLNATKTLGKGYEAGNICSKYYPADAIPEDDELIDDLRNLIGVYRELKGLIGSDIIEIKGKLDEDQFQEEIQEGKRKELKPGKIEKKSKKSNSSSPSWSRDRDIAFTALDNADFHCENNSGHETFISAKTGHQFVEAHHLVPMEFQGDFEASIDVPENIISLCPNCHRAFHNSVEETKSSVVRKFYNCRKDLLVQREIEISSERLLEFYKI